MKHSFSSSIISMKSSSKVLPKSYSCLQPLFLALHVLFLLALRLQSALGFFSWIFKTVLPTCPVGFGPEGAGEGDLAAWLFLHCMSPWQSLLLPRWGSWSCFCPQAGTSEGAGCCHHFQPAALLIPLVCEVQGVKFFPSGASSVFPWVSVLSPSAALSSLGGAAGNSLELLHLWGLMLQFPCSLCSPDSIKLLPNPLLFYPFLALY